MSQKDLIDLEKVVVSLQKCQIEDIETSDIVLSDTCNNSVLAMFPKPKRRVPPVFLHKPVKFPPHMREALKLGIKFYAPVVGNHYTRICCATFDDQKELINYFQNNHLPYHTYDHPENRKLKVVVRGLPNNVDLDCLIEKLRSAIIPIIQVHKMRNPNHAKDRAVLFLIVVPNNDEGRKILSVQKIFGYDIEIERPKQKAKQCHNCQKWGHSQRYCQGNTKCVKCGDDHRTTECSRNPAEEPPRCANCFSQHTANYKNCAYCPESKEYKDKQQKTAKRKTMFPSHHTIPRKLVTLDNCHQFLRGTV